MTQLEKDSRRLLNTFYKDICGYKITRKEDMAIRKARSLSTYGEITFASVRKILNYCKANKNSVFYDLGSGVGKMVMQVGMTKVIKKAVGIELAESRHNDAMQVYKQVKQMRLLRTANTKFLCADILKTSLRDASIVYTCSTVFPYTFMDILADKLTDELKPGTKIFTLQDFTYMGGLTEVGKMQLDMTWARNASVHLYER